MPPGMATVHEAYCRLLGEADHQPPRRHLPPILASFCALEDTRPLAPAGCASSTADCCCCCGALPAAFTAGAVAAGTFSLGTFALRCSSGPAGTAGKHAWVEARLNRALQATGCRHPCHTIRAPPCVHVLSQLLTLLLRLALFAIFSPPISSSSPGRHNVAALGWHLQAGWGGEGGGHVGRPSMQASAAWPLRGCPLLPHRTFCCSCGSLEPAEGCALAVLATLA